MAPGRREGRFQPAIRIGNPYRRDGVYARGPRGKNRLPDKAEAIDYARAAIGFLAGEDVSNAVVRRSAFLFSVGVWRTVVIAGPGRATGAAVKRSTATIGERAAHTGGALLWHATGTAVKRSAATVGYDAAGFGVTRPWHATGLAVHGSAATVANLAAHTSGALLWHAGTGGAVKGSTATVANLAAQTGGTLLWCAGTGAVKGSAATVANLAAHTGGAFLWRTSNITLGAECDAGFSRVSALGLITVVSDDL